ncbi:MAG TPA: arginase family protein [Prolixibacteraceae bacterium]|nr:arginase family protein [Prolixibacteraceae bacterium]
MLNELIIPASALKVVKQYEGSSDQLGHFLKSQVWDADHLPHVAILGLPEGRGSGCLQVAEAPDAIRRHLYALTTFPPEINIIDLGNIICGNELKDTYAAVKIVVEELSALNIPLLILGGSQELTVPLIDGFNQPKYNLVIVDDRIDNNERENSPADELYIDSLPIGTSVSVIAGQSYFICQQEHDIVAEGYNGEILTLGEIRADFKEMEPLLRESDLVSFDFGSLKSAEAPGQYRISPNGLTGEEACQIAWYSGISTKQTWFGLFGYSPSFDSTSFGAMMAAQIGWYFINGVSKRLDEEPIDEATNFEHYHIPIDGLDDPISFLQHPVSRRWWMEVPDENCDIFPVRIPCSKKDYRKACENEIPERWWKYFSKI